MTGPKRVTRVVAVSSQETIMADTHGIPEDESTGPGDVSVEPSNPDLLKKTANPPLDDAAASATDVDPDFGTE